MVYSRGECFKRVGPIHFDRIYETLRGSNFQCLN